MQNTKNWKLGLGAAGLLIVSGACLVPQITPAGAQTPVPMPGKKGKEKHPEIRKAIRNLQQAQTALQNAATDFGGHRAKALDATNIALSECQEALKFDK